MTKLFLLLLTLWLTMVIGMQRSHTPIGKVPSTSKNTIAKTRFLVLGGGSTPDQNEIALEKNFLYFQRTLTNLGFDPKAATYFFANGKDGQATIRYIDPNSQEQFKATQIPYLQGAATRQNLQTWLTDNQTSPRSVFFYFTGHGGRNDYNLDNNYLALWPNDSLSVKELAKQFDRLSPQATVVTMMSQCYAGSFANLIYDRGDQRRPLSTQNRCGFFATLKSLPSVGCTPQVNEADYRDYSSSFFAGLSGVSRTGQKIASTDYDRNGRVSFAEAHAYTKVHMQTVDLPISTSEAWLQQQTSRLNRRQILGLPIATLFSNAIPPQRYVITELTKKFTFDHNHSYRYSKESLALRSPALRPEDQALLVRLEMELLNVGMAQRIRDSGNQQQSVDLRRLQTCEAGSWVK